MCFFHGLHKDHKLLEINDEKYIQSDNFTIEEEIKRLNDIIKESSNLQEKLKKEIIEINNSYEIIDNEITQSFILKHENLIKKENDLKDKLKNEVTKIKETFEIILSEFNEIERINKLIKIMGKKEGENMIKILSYISFINTKIKKNKSFQNN